MMKDSDKELGIMCWFTNWIGSLVTSSRWLCTRKHLKDNGIKILSAMENIPDSPEGILLESLLERHEPILRHEELSQRPDADKGKRA